MSAENLRPDLQAQLPVLRLMLASSCVGRDICPTPPCACAQSLIDGITTAKIEKLRVALREALDAMEIAHKVRDPQWSGEATEASAIGRARAALALEQKADKP